MNIWQEPSKPLLNNSSIILKKLPLTFLAVDGCHWHVRYEEEELLGIPKGKLSKSLSWQFIDTSLQRGLLSPSVALKRNHQQWRAPIKRKKGNQLLSLAIANHGLHHLNIIMLSNSIIIINFFLLQETKLKPKQVLIFNSSQNSSV